MVQQFETFDATKSQVKGRIAIFGGPGSGKTYTALVLAKILAGDEKIVVLDSENRSSEFYADVFAPFKVAPLHPPYSVDMYTRAIEWAGQLDGFGVTVVDSISHAWAGKGGALEEVDRAAAATQNKFAGWRTVTPKYWDMIEAITHHPKHIIVCARSKIKHAVTQDERGRLEVKKLGMEPIIRDQFEYEFDFVVEINQDHQAVVTKTRMAAFTDRVFDPFMEQDAEEVLAWLTSGTAIEDRQAGQEADLDAIAEQLSNEIELEEAQQATPERTQGMLVNYARETHGLTNAQVGQALADAGFTAFDAGRWDEMTNAVDAFGQALQEA